MAKQPKSSSSSNNSGKNNDHHGEREKEKEEEKEKDVGVGGVGGGGITEEYDIELTWEEQIYDKFGRPTIRNSHAVASDTDNHSVYLFGGRSKGGTNNHLMILSINDKQRGWALLDTAGDVPSPRKSTAMVYHDGSLYLFGGNYKENCLDDFYKYDVKSRMWSRITVKGKAPCARDRHSLTLINEECLLLFGGYANSEQEFLNDLWSFDIRSKTWTLLAEQGTVPSPRYEHAAVGIGPFLVVVGGKSATGGTSDMYVFDWAKKTWNVPKFEEEVKMEPAWGQSAVVFHNKILIFGGWNGKACFNTIAIVDCRQMPWKWLSLNTGGTKPSVRVFHGAGVLKNNMVVVAGRNGSKRLNDTFFLDLTDISPGGLKRRMSLKETADLQNNLPPPKESSKLHQDFKTKKISLAQFDLKATLGTGSFGRVRLVKYKGSDEYFAMKLLRKSKVIEMKQVNHIKWEKKILSSIRHPFIVNLEASFQDKFFLYLILELVSGGEFFTLLKNQVCLKMHHCVFYGAQIVLVFQFLHRNKIVYRDLKPENLLIGADGYLRVTDFGFAKRLEKPYRTWTLCGTPEYIAPEILLNRGHSFSVDWWALGILLFEMFTGAPPFNDENAMKIYQKILDGRIDYPPSLPLRAKDFISKLLTKNLASRLGNQENGAVDVMKHQFFEGLPWRRILEKSVKPPYIPQLSGVDDTKHFDEYREDTDTEDIVLENDPFEHDF